MRKRKLRASHNKTALWKLLPSSDWQMTFMAASTLLTPPRFLGGTVLPSRPNWKKNLVKVTANFIYVTTYL